MSFFFVFYLFLVFSFSLLFCFWFFLFFLFFHLRFLVLLSFSSRPSRRQNPQKSSRSSYCKKDVPFVKIRFLGLGGQGVRRGTFEGDFAFMFLSLNCFTGSYNISFQKINFLSRLGGREGVYPFEGSIPFLSFLMFFIFSFSQFFIFVFLVKWFFLFFF